MNFRRVRWSLALISMGAFAVPLGIGASDMSAAGIQGSLQPGNPTPNDPNNPNNPPNNPNGPNPPGSNNPDKPNLPKKPKNPNDRKAPPKSPPSGPNNPNPPSGPNNPNPPSGPNNPQSDPERPSTHRAIRAGQYGRNGRRNSIGYLFNAGYSCRTTLRREVLIWRPPLYLMKPSLLNLFMKKLTRERVVPIISARVSCDTLGSIF